MTYVQIPEKHDALGFLALAKSGVTVVCLPENSYGVQPEHLRLLKRLRIPFRKLDGRAIRLPTRSTAA